MSDRDYIKCPTCGGTGGTERVGHHYVGTVAYPVYEGERCDECGGEGYVELPTDEEEPAAAE
jgi:DnaJ-class molecular chaperone